jgi:signal transduction histidine kinase
LIWSNRLKRLVNNLLLVITGNLELLEPRVDGDNARAFLKEAKDAAALGSQLTDQLLTFARQRQLDPHVVSLNELIIGVADMLRRTLGEQISLSFQLAASAMDGQMAIGQVGMANRMVSVRRASGVLWLACRA